MKDGVLGWYHFSFIQISWLNWGFSWFNLRYGWLLTVSLMKVFMVVLGVVLVLIVLIGFLL